MSSAFDPAASVRNPFAMFEAWREKRFAAECCRDLLKLHDEVQASHPELNGVDLYRQVVSKHVGGDAGVVDTVLCRAQQSYADWPISRDLNFRDVVHYLAVSGYWDKHGGGQWIYADVQKVVESTIPEGL